MNLEFLEELTESRMFRNSRDFSQSSNKMLANLSMIAILVSVIYRNHSWIKKYLENTIDVGDFDHVRSGNTDLANIITVLKNFSEYKIEVSTAGISFPVMQFRQFAREIINGNLSRGDCYRYLYAFEGYLKISDLELKNARRSAFDWESTSRVEKRALLRYIAGYLNSVAPTMDLTVWYKKEI